MINIVNNCPLARYVAGAVLLLVVLSSAVAEPLRADVTGGITLTAQHANDARVEQELLGSLCLFVTTNYLGGEWTMHAEGATTPRFGYVADTLHEANTDAGTVLTADHHGHMQISELKYLYRFNDANSLTVGVVEVAAYMDSAETAIDENTQFLGLSFKHNLAIEFPDYALGMIYQSQMAKGGPLLTFALSSSNGISDNPSASYAQALNIDSPGKGAFVALSSLWKGEQWRGEVGAWSHTAPHDTLDGASHNGYNYGVYTLLGRTAEQHAFDLRVGFSNPEVNQIKLFSALSYELRGESMVYGVGAARAVLSEGAKGEQRGNMSQYEIYARFSLSEGVELTPHLQHITNSGFDVSDSLYSPHINIIGVRLATFI